jgi:hypothetical protein
MKMNKNKIITTFLITMFIFLEHTNVIAQDLEMKKVTLKDKETSGALFDLTQKPSKKIYFTYGGKIGMFFLQGDYNGNQMIAFEVFGKFVGDNFFAEVSLPLRFKTSPAFTDIGIDLNVLYPFLGPSNKSEVDPYVGGGLGLHFIGKESDTGGGSIAARGGLGLNLILGTVFFKNYDFNVMVELKYFIYLREFDDRHYQGIGLNVGATLPR